MRAQKGHPEVQKGHTKGTGRKERKESPRGAMQFAKGVPLVPFVPLSLLKPIESPSKQGLFPSHRYPITTLSLPIIQTFRSDSTDIRQRYDREQATIHRRMGSCQADKARKGQKGQRDRRDTQNKLQESENAKSRDYYYKHREEILERNKTDYMRDYKKKKMREYRKRLKERVVG